MVPSFRQSVGQTPSPTQVESTILVMSIREVEAAALKLVPKDRARFQRAAEHAVGADRSKSAAAQSQTVGQPVTKGYKSTTDIEC